MPTAPKIDPNVAHLDFRGLRPRSGGKRASVPDGDYLLEVTDAKVVAIKSGANRGKPQIAWKFKIAAVSKQLAHLAEARKGIGDSLYLNTGIFKESKGLFFVRNLVDDLMYDALQGKSTTGSELDLRLDDKIGRTVGATLVLGAEEEWIDDDGNEHTSQNSEIKFTFPASKFQGAAPAASDDEDEGDEEEEAPAPKPAPKARSNGKAEAEAAAEAVSTADEDEDIEELPVQSL